jgi:fumarate hydratase subunit beta
MRRFNLPLSESERRSLVAGENILLSGELITARDAAHQRLFSALLHGETLPIDLTVSAIYYAGPSPTAPGGIIGSIGPTTSGRMDSYMPTFLNAGLRVTIGKGARNLPAKHAMKEVGAVYLGAIGGAGALYATCVKSVQIIAYPELQSEAIRSLIVEDFPVTVIIDADGNDRYAKFEDWSD